MEPSRASEHGLPAGLHARLSAGLSAALETLQGKSNDLSLSIDSTFFVLHAFLLCLELHSWFSLTEYLKNARQHIYTLFLSQES